MSSLPSFRSPGISISVSSTRTPTYSSFFSAPVRDGSESIKSPPALKVSYLLFYSIVGILSSNERTKAET